MKKTTIVLLSGLAMGLGPWILLQDPSVWWYPVSLLGGVMVAIVGYGAQMAQLGQGDTGEELLEELIGFFKKKSTRLQTIFCRKHK